MTRTDRRRFPILFAALAALGLTGAALALLFSPVQAQESETLLSNTGQASESGEAIETSTQSTVESKG